MENNSNIKNLDVQKQDNIQVIEKALAAYRKGEFLLVSDDEDRENEGDLIIAAEHASADDINFMITHGKGLVCLAITPEIANQKKLLPMTAVNKDPKGTAFTVSVDATPELGITTGISAGERARTIEVLISDDYSPEDLVAPGHMFPLVSKPGGLKERFGHTEAGVELSRLAGLNESAVIIEVIKEDGSMARRPDLELFAEEHGIQYITIEQIREYMAHLDSKDELKIAS